MYMHILSSSQHTFAEIIRMVDHIDLPVSVCLAVLALLVVAVWLEGVVLETKSKMSKVNIMICQNIIK